MDYKTEMKKMKLHRKLYGPVLKRMHHLYRNIPAGQLPVNLADDADIPIILELLDIEYLDREAFLVKKRFGTIEKVLYTGSGPLTDKGMSMLKDLELQKMKRSVFFAAVALAVMLVILAIMTC